MMPDDGTGAGTGGGDQPQNNSGGFDPAAFRTDVMTELNKAINGISKQFRTEITKLSEQLKPKPEPEGDGNAAPAPATTGTHANLPPEVSAEIQNLNRQLKKLKEDTETLNQQREEERKRRLEAERISTIKEAMNSVQFRDEASAKTFFKAIERDVRRNEEGELIAVGDDGVALPVADYVRSMAENLPGLLPPRGNGGSGAIPSSGKRRVVDIDDIKPGMSDEDRRAVFQRLREIQAQGR